MIFPANAELQLSYQLCTSVCNQVNTPQKYIILYSNWLKLHVFPSIIYLENSFHCIISLCYYYYYYYYYEFYRKTAVFILYVTRLIMLFSQHFSICGEIPLDKDKAHTHTHTHTYSKYTHTYTYI